MVIIHIAQNHRPFGNRVVRLAAAAAERGHKVTALMRCSEEQTYRNVMFRPAPRFKGWVSRFFSQIFILQMVLKIKGDVYHFHNPENLLLVFVVKLLRRKVVYDVHEDFSKRFAIRYERDKFLIWLLSFLVTRIEFVAGLMCDRVFTSQMEVASRIPGAIVIKNLPEFERLQKIPISSIYKPHSPANIYLGYMGTINKNRGIGVILDALLLLNKTSEIRLILIGDDRDETLQQLKNHCGWRYVDYFGVKHHEVGCGLLKNALVGLAVIDDVGDHNQAFPTKVYEYMAIGLVAICSDFPKWRETLGEENLCWWVDPGNPSELSRILSDLIDDQKLREVYIENQFRYLSVNNWSSEVDRVLLEYSRVISA